jgi:hypothetical protein
MSVEKRRTTTLPIGQGDVLDPLFRYLPCVDKTKLCDTNSETRAYCQEHKVKEKCKGHLQKIGAPVRAHLSRSRLCVGKDVLDVLMVNFENNNENNATHVREDEKYKVIVSLRPIQAPNVTGIRASTAEVFRWFCGNYYREENKAYFRLVHLGSCLTLPATSESDELRDQYYLTRAKTHWVFQLDMFNKSTPHGVVALPNPLLEVKIGKGVNAGRAERVLYGIVCCFEGFGVGHPRAYQARGGLALGRV